MSSFCYAIVKFIKRCHENMFDNPMNYIKLAGSGSRDGRKGGGNSVSGKVRLEPERNRTTSKFPEFP
jgi:hypothetical protein